MKSTYHQLPTIVDSSSGKVQLKFNRYFIPKEIGLSQDSRHLSAIFVRAEIIRPKSARDSQE